MNSAFSLTKDDLHHLAHLAKLQLDPAELACYQQDLNQLLKLITKMNEVDTSDVSALQHPYNHSQPLREDSVTEPDHHHAHLALAPVTNNGLYVVPKIISTNNDRAATDESSS